MSKFFVISGLLVVFSAQLARAAFPEVNNPPLKLEAHERLITIIGTNDIHGGVEPAKNKFGSQVGGLAHLAGVVRSIREGVAQRFGTKQAGVLVVDAGDQFQGTLVSNFTEGQLVFAAMSEIGYDAVVPGNHDYDFGPRGWLEDQVTPSSADKNPRGALERALSFARFPLLSANTYLKSSLKGVQGRTDWSRAKVPSFLKPYVIKKVAGGVRVALIGIDNPSTPTMTTQANVSDLHFDDEGAAYLRARKALEGRADVFVALTHNGDTDSSDDVTRFVKKLPAGAVDAVISGHTHWITNTRAGAEGVAIVQSSANGQRFGRIDLVYDTRTRKVVPSRTRSFGGIEMTFDRCFAGARAFCATVPGGVAYEGVPVVADARVAALIAEARKSVGEVGERKLGEASAEIRVDRTKESPLANVLTDGTRLVSGADIAFLNTGGIRAPLPAGDVTYEHLYRVLPFNNHGLVIGPMPAEKVLSLLARSVKTCGVYGALMQSGLRVEFERDCVHAKNQIDDDARVLRVETLAGDVVYDRARGIVPPAGRTFVVATLDFLAAGGAGYNEFGGAPLIRELGIMREALVEHYLREPLRLDAQVDGRWLERERERVAQ